MEGIKLHGYLLQGICCAQWSTCDCHDDFSFDFFNTFILRQEKNKSGWTNMYKYGIACVTKTWWQSANTFEFKLILFHFSNSEGSSECAYETGRIQNLQPVKQHNQPVVVLCSTCSSHNETLTVDSCWRETCFRRWPPGFSCCWTTCCSQRERDRPAGQTKRQVHTNVQPLASLSGTSGQRSLRLGSGHWVVGWLANQQRRETANHVPAGWSAVEAQLSSKYWLCFCQRLQLTSHVMHQLKN